MGFEYFRILVFKGIEIIEGLRGYIFGYVVLIFVVDVFGGGGKILVMF